MTASPADVGFVFVHGIGTHKPGDTLLTHAEPLVSWVSDWNDALGRERVSFGTVDLDGDGADPAHASVTVPLDAGREARWLLAEAHWADSFPAPSSQAVLLWGARFAVRLLRRVVGHLARPADLVYTKSLEVMGSVKKTSIEANERSPATGYTNGASLFVGAWYLVIGVLLLAAGIWIPAVAYLLALVLLGLVGLLLGTWAVAAVLLVALKVPGLRAKVSPLALNLATSAGDTHTLLSRPVLAAAMRDRVVSSILWVRDRADHVVVVAHSQGAALSTRALLHDPRLCDVQVDALVTLGGAVALLQDGTSTPVNDWQQLRPEMRWLNIWTAWDPVSAGPVVDIPKDAGERWRELYSPDPNAEPKTDLSEVIPWFYGKPADPEPAADPQTMSLPLQLAQGASGGLGVAYTEMANVTLSVIPSVELPVTRAVPGPTEIATHNRASLAGDHSSYMGNGPQVVRRIADLAVDLGGHNEDWLNDDMTAWAIKAERWHVTAVRVLGAARLISFMLATVAAWKISGSFLPAELFVRAIDLATIMGSDAAAWLERVPDKGPRTSVASIAIGAAIYLASNGLCRLTWSWWRFPIRPGRKGGSRPAAILLGTLLVLYAAVAGGIVWSIAESYGASDAWQYGACAAGGSMAVLLWVFGGFRPRLIEARWPEPVPEQPPTHRVVVSEPGEQVSAPAVTGEDLDRADSQFQQVPDANRSDPHGLDANQEGIACGSLARRSQTRGTLRPGGAFARTGSLVAGLTIGAALAMGIGRIIIALGRHRSRTTSR